MIRCASLIFISTCFLSEPLIAQKPVDVPLGKAVSIDGKIEAQEWADAAQHELANGARLFIKTDGAHVYLAMRGQKPGWSHLYLNEEGSSDLSVIHASAALGQSLYKQDTKKLWQPQNEFIWEVRERTITAEARAAMDAHLAKNRWVASNNNMGSANEVEYKFAPKGTTLRVAAAFMSEGVSPSHFPITLADDTLNRRLVTGYTPPDLKFDVSQWAELRIPVNAASAEGFWEGVVTREGKQWRVNANIERSSASIDFVDLDIADVAFPMFVNGTKLRLEKPQPNGRPPVIFDGEVSADNFSGSWKGLGVDGSFSLRRGTKQPDLSRDEEVSFQNGDVKLSGTLVLPKGPGRYPAVVITHGSSPNERSGYRSWARRFAKNGIAALIYDKRGTGRSTGNTRAASMEDLADDAIAGLNFLKTRVDVESEAIGVAGHSQGGWIAPLAAVRSKDVAFVIASAAAAVTPAEQSIYHRAGLMRSEGITEPEIEQATRLRERLYELNRKILKNDGMYQQERAAISQELIANSKARWFSPAELPPQLAGEIPPHGALRLLFFDPVPVWEKVAIPTLVIWGDKDVVVPVDKSRSIIEKAQAKAGNKQLTVRIFPNVDHGNNIVAAGDQWDFPRVSMEPDRAIVDWVRTVTRMSEIQRTKRI